MSQGLKESSMICNKGIYAINTEQDMRMSGNLTQKVTFYQQGKTHRPVSWLDVRPVASVSFSGPPVYIHILHAIGNAQPQLKYWGQAFILSITYHYTM